MMNKNANATRGVTMLEMLLASFVLAVIAVSTMQVLGDGRVLRERARHRAELALAAQGELDRLRALPPAQLKEGRQTVRREGWPPTIAAEKTVRKRADGFLELNVSARRQSPGGDLKVELATIHPGGRR